MPDPAPRTYGFPGFTADEIRRIGTPREKHLLKHIGEVQLELHFRMEDLNASLNRENIATMRCRELEAANARLTVERELVNQLKKHAASASSWLRLVAHRGVGTQHTATAADLLSASHDVEAALSALAAKIGGGE